MQSNSTTSAVGTATYTVIDTIAVSPTTCQIVDAKVVHSDKDNSNTQIFELEFLGEYKGAGLQKSYRRLGASVTKTGEPFTVEPLKTLDNCEIIVSKRDSDGAIFFSVKGKGKDFAAETAEAAERAKSIFG
jgi:hypothetical protein